MHFMENSLLVTNSNAFLGEMSVCVYVSVCLCVCRAFGRH